MERVDKEMIVIDSSRFDRAATFVVASPDGIDTLVSCGAPGEALTGSLEKAGVEEII